MAKESAQAATLVLPGGPLLAPQLMKLAFVLVLGGLVLLLIDRNPTSPPPLEDGP